MVLNAITDWDNRKEVIYSLTFLALLGAYLAGGKYPSLASGFPGFATAILAWMGVATAGHVADAKLNP